MGTANISELAHTGRGPAGPINSKRLYYVVCLSGCTQEQGKVTGRVNGPAPVVADILTNRLVISQIKGYAPKCDTGSINTLALTLMVPFIHLLVISQSEAKKVP